MDKTMDDMSHKKSAKEQKNQYNLNNATALQRCSLAAV
jgi:hypothetical protein